MNGPTGTDPRRAGTSESLNSERCTTPGRPPGLRGEVLAGRILQDLNLMAIDYIRDPDPHGFSTGQLAKIAAIQKEFKSNPDVRGRHEPNWHQWGITTHTRKVFEALTAGGEVDRVLASGGLGDAVDSYLDETIDGLTKRDLLIVSVPLHDLGKYAHGFKVDESGEPKPEYDGHEALSGRLIRSDGPVLAKLHTLGLTPRQIEYVAMCAELHFELGKVRSVAKKNPGGYTVNFVDSEAFREAAARIICEHCPMAVEIGLYFLADSYGKTDTRIIQGPEGLPVITTPERKEPDAIPISSHAAVESMRSAVIEHLKGRQRAGEDLDERLVNTILQLPVNEKVGIAFLRLAFAERRSSVWT